jgi:DNA uptake protein ComE-like DNA-binding protein
MMNRKIVKLALVLVVGCAGATWSSAQDEAAASGKKPVSKVLSPAQVKALNKKKAAEAKAAAEARAKAVDLNHASREVLKKLPGMTDAYADAIIAKRPYKSKADLVTKNAIPLSYYQSIRKLVAAK